MGLLTFSINVTLDGCVDHQEGIADDVDMIPAHCCPSWSSQPPPRPRFPGRKAGIGGKSPGLQHGAWIGANAGWQQEAAASVFIATFAWRRRRSCPPYPRTPLAPRLNL